MSTDNSMSETKHTPGPWSVCSAKGCQCLSVLYRDGVICDVKNWHSEMADATGHAPSPEEAQANKRLIAAAPELLACLRGYVRQTEDEGPILSSDIRRLELARAAIAKAEGTP